MPSLNEHFENYLNECQYVRRLRSATIRSSKESFKHFLHIVPEITELSDITRETVAVFYKRLQTRERIVGIGELRIGVKDSTIIAYSSRLKTFFKWMHDRGHITTNPFDAVKLPQPKFIDRRALTGDQVKRILTAVVENAPNKFLLRRDLAIIGVLTFCGLRKNELISLELGDIDLFNGFVTIRPETSKSKRMRRLPVNKELKLILSEYLRERKKRGSSVPHLFLSNNADRPFTVHGLKHWVVRLSRLSKVRFHLHRLRHTFATNLAMADVGVVKIQRLLGHTDIKMTQTYLRSVVSEDLREDVNKLSYDNLTNS